MKKNWRREGIRPEIEGYLVKLSFSSCQGRIRPDIWLFVRLFSKADFVLCPRSVHMELAHCVNVLCAVWAASVLTVQEDGL